MNIIYAKIPVGLVQQVEMFLFLHKNTIYLYGLYQNVPWESAIKYPVLWYQCYTHVFLKIRHVNSFAFPVFQVLNILYKHLQQCFFLADSNFLWNKQENKKYILFHFHMINKQNTWGNIIFKEKEKKKTWNKFWKQFTLFPSFIFPFKPKQQFTT